MVATPHTISNRQGAQLRKQLDSARSKKELYEKIVNAPFTDRVLSTTIDLGIVVLLLVDSKRKTVNRVALSDTEQAKNAVRVSAKPFRDIKIPLASKKNIISQAIRENAHRLTGDWQYLFFPALNSQEARLNQANASIESSLVWPLKAKNGGAMIFSFYQPMENIDGEHVEFARYYCALVDEAIASKR